MSPTLIIITLLLWVMFYITAWAKDDRLAKWFVNFIFGIATIGILSPVIAGIIILVIIAMWIVLCIGTGIAEKNFDEEK